MQRLFLHLLSSKALIPRNRPHSVMNRGRTRRARLKRSKTGCRTCRARHVKCDENPGKCQNCTSTRRQRDGYDTHRLLFPTRQTRHSERLPLSPPVAVTVPWSSTSDERRCFGFVQARTIPDVLGYFDSDMGAICAADGAVHQHMEPGLMGGSTVWELMAVAQSTRSFACLRRRNPRDTQMREVTLVSCLLFTIKNVVRQELGTAVQHIRAGLRILDGDKLSTSSAGQPLHLFWLHAFRHLDTQIGSDRLLMGPCTVSSARHMLEPLYNRFFKFIRQCWRMSRAGLQSATATPVLAEQTGHLHGDPAALQRFTPQYRDLLNRESTLSCVLPQRPTLLVDMGVLLTIFFVGDGCQDLSVRWEALRAHFALPHQEGPFRAPLMAARLKHLICAQLRVRVRADLVASFGLASYQPVKSCLEEIEELVETETDLT
ncbi:hypothetical protein ASPACDRAFT_40951 [Aspergillus aculeatus ATCC 16872]|uniref:Zn(2)-C6 fungal-type domain-containing protein n=1 Tax=Aspergillus aculeatus (strain ATCC 16872 / CBS 172.66 / WB 5094) TaxID=690307 RepID=A0A1L9X138_ASPA1|nr:uncharacterized protein ASPACDRAFT_40951 [Aspergillus aculeatus ATCC 16872]OJK02133.1 hypothetical protein ASPACDRAFT_40951 [Aspergillus aculeatus ATCC 16872]